MTVAAWIAAYVTRMPIFPTPVPGQVTVLLMVAMIFLGGFLTARYSKKGAVAALLAGLLSGVLDILILGSMVHDTANGALVPTALEWMGGSILLNGVVAGLGGAIGMFFPSRRRAEIRWPAVFALVLAVATLPLLTAGGLVTAYGAGMAVPDWPQSYGYNMFLFPLSRMQAVPGATGGVNGNFFEHAHRLMGSLVGLTSLTLMLYLLIQQRVFSFSKQRILTICSIVGTLSGVALPLVLFLGIPIACVRARRPLALAAWCIFAAVCVQGILGGLRVTENNIPLATIHGIFAQIVFASMACLAAASSESFIKSPRPVPGATDRFFSATLLVLLIVQLALGVLVRRRVDWLVLIHITVAAGVALMALVCGFRALAMHSGVPGMRPLKRAGVAVMFVVGVQLLLGIIALALRPTNPGPQSTLSALWTTAHQANGAILLATCALLWLWNRRLFTAEHAPLVEPALA